MRETLIEGVRDYLIVTRLPVRDCLIVTKFGSLLETRALLEDWRTEYNCERAHSALGMVSPTEFARAWTTRQSQLQLA